MAALGPILKNRRQLNFRRLKYFVKIVDIGSLTQLLKYCISHNQRSASRLPHWKWVKSTTFDPYKAGRYTNRRRKILYTHARAILRQCEQAQLRCITLVRHYRGKSRLALHQDRCVIHHHALITGGSRWISGVVIYLHENSGAVLNEKLINHNSIWRWFMSIPLWLVYPVRLAERRSFSGRNSRLPGAKRWLNAIAQMNLFLPSDYSAIRLVLMRLFPYGDSRQKLLVKLSYCHAYRSDCQRHGRCSITRTAARSLCGAVNGWMSRITTPPWVSLCH